MMVFDLDAAEWKGTDDIYSAILAAVRAPDWHGHSTDALVDSMVYGDINEIDPPYSFEIHNTKGISNEILEHLKLIESTLRRHSLEISGGREVPEIEFKYVS
jgi:hypothetical protein